MPVKKRFQQVELHTRILTALGGEPSEIDDMLVPKQTEKHKSDIQLQKKLQSNYSNYVINYAITQCNNYAIESKARRNHSVLIMCYEKYMERSHQR